MNSWVSTAADALEANGFDVTEIRILRFDFNRDSWVIQNRWARILEDTNYLEAVHYWLTDYQLEEHCKFVAKLLQEHNEPFGSPEQFSLSPSKPTNATIGELPRRIPNGDWIDYLRALFLNQRLLKEFHSTLEINTRHLCQTLDISRVPNESHLADVAFFAVYFLRAGSEFRGNGYHALIDHLFLMRSVPACLYQAWDPQRGSIGDRLRDIALFIAFAQGISLRLLTRELGWLIPRNLLHYLQLVPCGLDLRESIVYAEVLRLGGTERDARRLITDRSFVIDFIDPKINNLFVQFWRDTIAWIIKHREAITDDQSAKILAWAQHCYTEGSLGRQAAFSWKRRSPAAAIHASEAYNDENQRHYFNPSIHLLWNNHGWDWEHTDDSELVWKFRELTSGIELFQEGQAMRHCVGSYASACANGRCAIFSLCRNDQRVCTIELDLATKEVVQARGRFNQVATSAAIEIIELWRKSIVIAAIGSSSARTLDTNPIPGADANLVLDMNDIDL